MRFSTVKKYRRKHKLLGALFMRNPVLVMGLDLPFVIAAATSLKNAVAMAIQMFIIHMLTVLFGMAIRRRLPLWLRALACAGVSTLATVAVRALLIALFQGISNTLGMYLFLMAVNTMTVMGAAHVGRREMPRAVLSTALSNALGFSLVALVVALLREYFGSGTLWGIAVPVPIRLSGLLIPFSGFIIMGFLLALTRFINKILLAGALRETARKESRYTKIHVDSVEIID